MCTSRGAARRATRNGPLRKASHASSNGAADNQIYGVPHAPTGGRRNPVGDSDDLDLDFAALKAEFASLQAEHGELESRPVDIPEHEAHRARLREHIAALRQHIRRVRAAREHPAD